MNASNNVYLRVAMGLMALSLLMLTGCETLGGGGTFYTVEVSCLAARSFPAGASYVILPGNQGVGLGDLQFNEYAMQTARMMALKGYRYLPVEQKAIADMAIVLRYGISGPQQKFETVSRPQFGTSGYQFMGDGYFAPVYGYTGYANETEAHTEYIRFVSLTAVDPMSLKEGAMPVELWKAEMTSSGWCPDLRTVFPFMLTAGSSFLMGNTGASNSITVAEINTDAVMIKGLTPLPPEASIRMGAAILGTAALAAPSDVPSVPATAASTDSSLLQKASAAPAP